MGKRVKKYKVDLRDSVIWYPPPNNFYYDPDEPIIIGSDKSYPNGSKHYMWKGGRYQERRGYREVYKPDHPYSNYKGRVYEHRVVMESILKRYLKSYEIVHHIDENKSNNDPSNLELKSREEHRSKHSKKDMSDRKCLRCDSKETYRIPSTGYLIWLKEGDGFICYYCGLDNRKVI